LFRHRLKCACPRRRKWCLAWTTMHTTGSSTRTRVVLLVKCLPFGEQLKPWKWRICAELFFKKSTAFRCCRAAPLLSPVRGSGQTWMGTDPNFPKNLSFPNPEPFDSYTRPRLGAIWEWVHWPQHDLILTSARKAVTRSRWPAACAPGSGVRPRGAGCGPREG
jgi:hypothetical protein